MSCIPVSNAVVECLFSHVASVLQMWKIVILNVLKAGINAVSFLLLWSCVLGVFNSPAATSANEHLGVFDHDLYWRTRVCFIYLCQYPRSHFTKLLTRALFSGYRHCLYIFVPRQAFRVHVASDLNTAILFVVGVLSTSLAHAAGYLGSSVIVRFHLSWKIVSDSLESCKV